MDDEKPKAMAIDIDDATARGQYVNLAMVAHSAEEFFLDFVFMSPGATRGRVAVRLVTSPAHAKRLVVALSDNVAKFEKNFGIINMDAGKQITGPMS